MYRYLSLCSHLKCNSMSARPLRAEAGPIRLQSVHQNTNRSPRGRSYRTFGSNQSATSSAPTGSEFRTGANLHNKNWEVHYLTWRHIAFPFLSVRRKGAAHLAIISRAWVCCLGQSRWSLPRTCLVGGWSCRDSNGGMVRKR